MKLVEPSYTIFRFFGEKSLLAKVGRCIQSLQDAEGEFDQDTVSSLLQKYIHRGEEQFLESGDLAFDIRLDSESPINKLFERQPSGLNIDRTERRRYILSGNIRALRNLCRAHKDLKIIKALMALLLKDYEPLFVDVIPRYRPMPLEGLIINYISSQELDQLPLEFKIRHLYIAAHLRVTMYAAQELITGCRLSSYVIQSITRDKQPLCFIKPPGRSVENNSYKTWLQAINEAEKAFLKLGGLKNESQSILPLALKTDLIINTNLLEWIQVLKFGIKKAIASEIHMITSSIFKEIKQVFPDVFENIILLPEEI